MTYKNKLTLKQQVDLFCKQHNITCKACRLSKTILLQKQHSKGSMWVEVFNNYSEIYDFLKKEQECFLLHGKLRAWDRANYK